jgi:hypothetical protein
MGSGRTSLQNDPTLIAEVIAVHDEYERALVNNDIGVLERLFWDSADVVRFGPAESLYGSGQIAAFRQARSTVDLARTVWTMKVVSFGPDTAITTIEFERSLGGVATPGRQTQVWRKFDEGWRIVSAHISFAWGGTGFLDHAAQLIGLPIPPEFRAGVRTNLARAGSIAGAFLDFPLDDSVDAAPVFQP